MLSRKRSAVHNWFASRRGVLTFVAAHVASSLARTEGQGISGSRSNSSGDLHWSLGLLRQFNSDREEWIKTVLTNPEDPDTNAMPRGK